MVKKALVVCGHPSAFSLFLLYTHIQRRVTHEEKCGLLNNFRFGSVVVVRKLVERFLTISQCDRSSVDCSVCNTRKELYSNLARNGREKYKRF